jgi:predicted nucleotidyltransferase
MSNKATLERICQRFGVNIMYAFGSRADELFAWLQGRSSLSPAHGADADIGVTVNVPLSIRRKAELAIALEDVFGVSRVDLVMIPEADPFLAANIIRGERLYAADDRLADEYDLYVLRRAGDLIPLERERQQLIMEGVA